jgi:MoaA/NifB/PqqE/SkfB family radical SAM enzyme
MHVRRFIPRALAYLRRYGARATVSESLQRVSRLIASGDTPTAVHVEVSNVCNLRCEYCVLSEGTEGDRIMSQETFERLLPSLARARRIDLSGLAEPLMHRRFVPMLAEVRAVAPRAHITMCTNATMLTPEVSRQLVDLGLDELVFSLDGVDPALVDSVRRGGSLDAVLDNIAVLRDVRRESGSDRPVLSATLVLQRENLDQLEGVVRLAAELGCDAVNINGLEPYSDTLVGHELWTGRAEPERLSAAFRAAERTARELGIELRFPALSPQKAECPQIFRPIVLADGTVVPCSVLAYARRSVLGVGADGAVESRDGRVERRSFGNTNEGGLDAVWSDAGYRAFRRAVRRGEFPEPCGACLLKHNVICPTPPLSADESLATLRSAR